MRLRNYTILYITTLLFLLFGTADSYAQHWDPSIDPEDTLDEVDLKALKDKIPMSRKNTAKTQQGTGMVNALDYVLDDFYAPKNETFTKNFWNHVYLGLAGGGEKIIAQADGYSISPIYQVYAMMGKDFSNKHGVRVMLGGGWGYDNLIKYPVKRISMRADYLFNISTLLSGYNPSRKLELKAFLGASGHYTMMTSRQSHFVPEGHLGFQLQIYTGHRGYLNIEPYVGIGPDNLDLSEASNWKRCDVFWGIQANYAFYLKNHLSPESKLRLLQYRSIKDRVVDSVTIDSWRTPWFVEASSGFSFLKSDALSMGQSLGSNISIAVGRWFSPVVGGRITFGSRNTNYAVESDPAISYQGPRTAYLPMRYVSGRVELLFNPLGYSRNFTWDNPWGFHIVAGGEFGMLRKTISNTQSMRTYSAAYNLGLHVWYKLSEDLQVFAEPRFTHNIYTAPYSNVDMNQMYGDNHFAVDLGLTMFIRSYKFHDLYEFDDVQKYNYRHQRGVRIGVGAGLLNMQRSTLDYGGGKINWSATAFVEYRFNFLHSVRASAELFNLSRQSLLSCRNGYYDIYNEYQVYTGKRIFDVNSKMALFSLDYQINLTNLCSGILKNRKFELEAFVGPALSLSFSRKVTLGTEEPADGVDVASMLPAQDTKPHFGANAGLKLTTYIWKGISAFFSPNIYVIKNNNPDVNATTNLFGSGWQMYQSFTLGIQYKCGKARLNPWMVKRWKEHYNANWQSARDRAIADYQQQQRAKQMKRQYQFKEWQFQQKKKEATRKQKKYVKIEVEADD